MAGFILNTVVLKCRKSLQYKNAAGKKTRQKNDRQRPNSDHIHLPYRFREIARFTEQTYKSPPDQQADFLKFGYEANEGVH